MELFRKNFFRKIIKVKCRYCNKIFDVNDGCKECDPHQMIEGWTSGNADIDKFIKDTMYKARDSGKYLNWILHDKFVDISQLYEDDFEEIYLATWLKKESQSVKVVLKKFIGLPVEHLNEIMMHWNFNVNESFSLKFYGMTKDPKTQEFIMVTHYGNQGDLRNFLKSKFNSLKWKDKIELLCNISKNLKNLHRLGYCHNNFYSGNIILDYYSNSDSEKETYTTYITNFRLTRLANITTPNDKVFGVLPYTAPEIMKGESCSLASDIYSFGVIMTELSSGKPPFNDTEHDIHLSLGIICNGTRPEFGERTPEIYKELALKCMDAKPEERPKAKKLYKIFKYWYNCIIGNKEYADDIKFGYREKNTKSEFEEADSQLPNNIGIGTVLIFS